MTLAERNSLIEKHVADIRAMARSMSRRLPPCFDSDRLSSAGFVGAIEAAERYDPSKGDFWRFALPRVRGAMMDEIRRDWVNECHVELTRLRIFDRADPESLLLQKERERILDSKLLRLSRTRKWQIRELIRRRLKAKLAA